MVQLPLIVKRKPSLNDFVENNVTSPFFIKNNFIWRGLSTFIEEQNSISYYITFVTNPNIPHRLTEDIYRFQQDGGAFFCSYCSLLLRRNFSWTLIGRRRVIELPDLSTLFPFMGVSEMSSI